MRKYLIIIFSNKLMIFNINKVKKQLLHEKEQLAYFKSVGRGGKVSKRNRKEERE